MAIELSEIQFTLVDMVTDLGSERTKTIEEVWLRFVELYRKKPMDIQDIYTLTNSQKKEFIRSLLKTLNPLEHNAHVARSAHHIAQSFNHHAVHQAGLNVKSFIDTMENRLGADVVRSAYVDVTTK